MHLSLFVTLLWSNRQRQNVFRHFFSLVEIYVCTVCNFANFSSTSDTFCCFLSTNFIYKFKIQSKTILTNILFVKILNGLINACVRRSGKMYFVYVYSNAEKKAKHFGFGSTLFVLPFRIQTNTSAKCMRSKLLLHHFTRSHSRLYVCIEGREVDNMSEYDQQSVYKTE